MVRQLRETLRQDLARNDYPLSPLTLFTFRLGQVRNELPRYLRWPARVLYKFLDRVYLQVVLGADLPAEVVAGPGLRLPHGGRGLVVHPAVVLGDRVTLYHRVTLGVRDSLDDAPRLGDDVYVGAGACVLGAVDVGSCSSIGANAVVVTDIPAGATAVGAAARVIERPSESEGKSEEGEG